MQYVIFKRQDGGVSVMQHIKGDVKDCITRYLNEKPGSTYEILSEPPKLPENRLFRDAWGHALEVRQDKAEEIHMSRIREKRNEKLKELDMEMMRNITQPDVLKVLEARKKDLRDIPQNFDVKLLDVKKPHKAWPKDLDLHEDY